MLCRKFVEWLPRDTDDSERFILLGNELSLYSIKSGSGSNEELRLNEYSSAVQQTVTVSLPNVSCLQQHPTIDYIVAAGYNNGRVSIVSPFVQHSDPRNLIGREFIPKHSFNKYACNALAWCPHKDAWLAAATDRHKQENSVLVYDVVSRPSPSPEPDPGPLRLSSSQGSGRTTFEAGAGDCACSLAWIGGGANRLAASMVVSKHIAVFDIRQDPRKPQMTIATRGLNGLECSPQNDYHLLSFVDQTVFLWDLRAASRGNVEKPLFSVSEATAISMLRWDPIKRGTFASLCTDSSFIKIYHTLQLSAEDHDISTIDNHVWPNFVGTSRSRMVVEAFSYHPVDENRLLSLSSGGQLSVMNICERSCIEFTAGQQMAVSFGKQLYLMNLEDNTQTDISQVMHKRALEGYGLNLHSGTPSPSFGIKPISGDSVDCDVNFVWSYLVQLKTMSSNLPLNTPPFNKIRYPGIMSQFPGPSTEPGTKCVSSTFKGLHNDSVRQQIYISPCRDRLMKMCGWGGAPQEEGNDAVDRTIERLHNQQPFRAAAIALFTLKYAKAAEMLSMVDGSVSDVSVVAMSMAGYSEAAFAGTHSLWHNLCTNNLPNIQNPYLKAILQFLLCRLNTDTLFTDLLHSNLLAVQDKIAFACLHLPDHTLQEFLKASLEGAVTRGDLHGILLSGLSVEEGGRCVQLLEKYVDVSGDVQTAALLLMNSASFSVDTVIAKLNGSQASAMQEEPIDNENPAWRIIDSYLSLLNHWKLWQVRAKTENMFVEISARGQHFKIPAQIYLNCGFCGKSTQLQPNRYSASIRGRQYKYGSCPGGSCKKPLPRCSVCRRHMGLPTNAVDDTEGRFGWWFTWCQSCKHGGHTNHLTQWFDSNVECPVVGCSCKCNTLDVDI